jgi:dGTPase
MPRRLYHKRDEAREKTLPDNDQPYRTNFRRDYDRILHSPNFRRLQSKTQVFPGNESDFFRTRLTHSLEVAQIASSIAIRLNAVEPFFAKTPINLDIVQSAGLAHDVGHPPFGHNGELALNKRMKKYGGFEGNAQTLRILTRLARRETTVPRFKLTQGTDDRRIGLNLTARTLAGVLKYDQCIVPAEVEKTEKPIKGYFLCENDKVQFIKKNVLGSKWKNAVEQYGFHTVECGIMDLADDIAYSVFDLEDAFAGGFLDPLSMLGAEMSFFDVVARDVNESRERTKKKKRIHNGGQVSGQDVLDILVELFKDLFNPKGPGQADFLAPITRAPDDPRSYVPLTQRVFRSAKLTAEDNESRSDVTSRLVRTAIKSIKVVGKPNYEWPVLTQIRMDDEEEVKIEVVKSFVYNSVIHSPRIQVARVKGREIIETIFQTLNDDRDAEYFPSYYKPLLQKAQDAFHRARFVCDFIAGMTDRYATDFYLRLTGAVPPTIYKGM